MNKKLLIVFAASGALSFTAQAQTTPAGNRPAGTTARPATPTGKAGQSNSGDTAPNRSTTAGNPTAGTSNNPVDATGKPVGTSQSTTTSPGKTRKPKN